MEEWNKRTHLTLSPSAEDPLPLVIGRNDYSVGLFNGDDIVLWRDKAFFQSPAGVHQISLSRLPFHQSGYAMSIHRSQGSEFGNVLIILPSVDSTLLNRELLYVAVSRAKSSIILVGSPNSLINTLGNTQDLGSGFSKIMENYA